MAWLSTEFYYYKGSPPCRAVWMTLKMLNVEYEAKEVDLLKAENKRPWFLRMNPQHTVPTFNDHSFILWESRAIMMNQRKERKVDRMLFFDMGTLYHSIKEYFAPKIYDGLPPDPEKENLLKTSLDHLDHFLEIGGVPYLCGERITIADVAVLASVTELDAMEYNYRCYGEFNRWVERVKAAIKPYKECCEEGVRMTKDRTKFLETEVKKQMEKERKASLPKK
ncbi:hypothetical protein O3P69_005638 [Scylla paramamosain]|uniref:Uncharacterized protein n=1 Tax=Scylla paramamosain TaxID=85552 RepID=A0AAW0U8J3_SCYPA